MNIAVLAVLLAVRSQAAVGQEAALAPRQRYDALVKEYTVAVEVWSKVYDQTPQKPDPIKRHQDWPGWSLRRGSSSWPKTIREIPRRLMRSYG